MSKQTAFLMAMMTTVALTGTALAADAANAVLSNSAVHAGVLMLLTFCLASLRLRRRDGKMRFGFELSPVRRVRALSTVHGVRRATRD